jgi:hypothetical protein
MKIQDALVDARAKWKLEPASSARTAFYYKIRSADNVEILVAGRTYCVGVRRAGDFFYIREDRISGPIENAEEHK